MLESIMTTSLTARQLAMLCAALYGRIHSAHPFSAEEGRLATASERFPALSVQEISVLFKELSDLLAATLDPRQDLRARAPIGISGEDPKEDPVRVQKYINLVDVPWEDVSPSPGRPRTRLVATVYLNRVPHYLEAIEIRYGRGYRDQLAMAAGVQHQLALYQEIDPESGPFFSVRIEERNYALFLTPHRYSP